MSSINNYIEPNVQKETATTVKADQIDHMMSPFNKKTRALTSGKNDALIITQETLSKTENGARSRQQINIGKEKDEKTKSEVDFSEEKVIITGDDILIEYVKRVMNVVQ